MGINAKQDTMNVYLFTSNVFSALSFFRALRLPNACRGQKWNVDCAKRSLNGISDHWPGRRQGRTPTIISTSLLLLPCNSNQNRPFLHLISFIFTSPPRQVRTASRGARRIIVAPRALPSASPNAKDVQFQFYILQKWLDSTISNQPSTTVRRVQCM